MGWTELLVRVANSTDTTPWPGGPSTIRLRRDRSRGVWLADFSGDPGALMLAGGTVFATGFLARASARVVRDRVAAINPDARVVVDVGGST